MEKRKVSNLSEFVVTEKAMRPASPKQQCFYCQQAIGQHHKHNCVLVHKKVKVRMSVEYEIEVPAHWAADRVERHRNEGSWCGNNAFDELANLAEENSCLCGVMTYKVLKETSDPYLDE